MKKLFLPTALLLIISMMIGLVAACGTDTSTQNNDSAPADTAAATDTDAPPTLEHMTITTSLVEFGAVSSYTDDDMYRHFTEKFNIDLEISMMTWDNWAERNRLWINGGTMPDFTFWDFNFDEYVSYANQGLIAPLPDGWETKYPNIYNMIVATGIYEKLLIDGRIYAIPKPVFMHFSPVERALAHTSVFYRMDWLEELGLEPFGPLVSEDDLWEFARLAIEADLAGNGNTIGIAANAGNITSQIMNLHNNNWETFAKIDGEYVWGPTMPGTTAGISRFRELYHQGIIDPDFYLDQALEPNNKFASGLAAALIGDGVFQHYQLRAAEFLSANPGLDPFDSIGITSLATSDGRWTGREWANFWSAHVFNPDIDSDKFHRILMLMDYTASREALEIIGLGIKGVDWDFADDGSYQILREVNADGTFPDIIDLYPSRFLWCIMSVLLDDFYFVDPTLNPIINERVNAVYAARAQYGDYAPLDLDFHFFTSDALSMYSVDIESEIVRLVLDRNADIDTSWSNFIERNRALWEPVVNDLNEAFAGR